MKDGDKEKANRNVKVAEAEKSVTNRKVCLKFDRCIASPMACCVAPLAFVLVFNSLRYA